MDVKMMPDNMGGVEVDLSNPNKALISGLYQEFVQFNGKSRSFLTYIPENQEYCRPCLVVTVPSDEKQSEYLETSGLKLPLVVVMHGRGGSAETFFDMSGMPVLSAVLV